MKNFNVYFKIKKLLILGTSSLILLVNNIAYAAGTELAPLSSTKDLLKSLSTSLLAILPIAAGLMIGFHSLMKALSEGDPGTVADRNKKIKNTLIALAIGESGAAIVTFVSSYFQAAAK